ncbi:hypothetical protein ACHAWF_004413 [Thalassiosira exigua]
MIGQALLLPILSIASFLLPGSVHALRPAPFQNEYTFEAPSGARLVSTIDGDDMLSPQGTTEVFGADGDRLYEIPIFTGRRAIDLSPAGSVVVLDGNVYFGTSFMRADGDEVVTSVYLDGELWKEVWYDADLQGEPLEGVIGGGWTRRPFSMEVDWDRNALVYTFHDDMGVDVEIPLPGQKYSSRGNLRGAVTE